MTIALKSLLDAIGPGTDLPIHWHPVKDESFVVLRGIVRSTTVRMAQSWTV